MNWDIAGNLIWWFWISWFIVFEAFTLLTKEKYYPSLSRWVWRKTTWQVRWKTEAGFVISTRPLRILLLVGMSWAIIHLSFGECAFNLC